MQSAISNNLNRQAVGRLSVTDPRPFTLCDQQSADADGFDGCLTGSAAATTTIAIRAPVAIKKFTAATPITKFKLNVSRGLSCYSAMAMRDRTCATQTVS